MAEAANAALEDLRAAADDIPYGKDGGPEARDLAFVVSRMAASDDAAITEELFRVYSALLDSYSRQHCKLGGGQAP